MRTKYLAIDYGEKRIGMAVTDEDKKYSFSRDFMFNDSNFFSKLINLVKSENISRIIIGHPLNLKSEKTLQTLKTEEFKTALEKLFSEHRLNVDLEFFDERFTSSIAEAGILNSGLRKKKRREKGLVDSLSAQIILQDYIDKINKNTTY